MRTGKRRRFGISLGIIASWLLAAAFAKGEEKHTFAYVLDEDSYWQLTAPAIPSDPFAPDAVPSTKPKKITSPPQASRFFQKDDQLWSITERLKQDNILSEDESWATWNKSSARLIIRGSIYEHGLFSLHWKSMDQPVLIETEVSLMRVSCPELGMVEWTESEVKKRVAKTLSSTTTIARPGEKAQTKIGTGHLAAHLETEAYCGSDYRAIEVIISFSAPTEQTSDGKRLTLPHTNIAFYSGSTIYLDVGGTRDAGFTYLVGVRCETQFMDGTPRSIWREHENPLTQTDPLPVLRSNLPLVRKLKNGLVQGTWSVHPSFPEDISASPFDGDADPFADDGAPPEAKSPPYTTVTAISPSWGFAPTDLVLELRANLNTDGPTATQLSTGLTLINGRPLLVPVSSKDGKNRGVLFQTNIMDGTGAHH